MGRRAPAVPVSLGDLEAGGARVVIAQGDVAREDDVRRVLAEIAADMPPLRGVFHLAGVLDDGVLAQQTWARFEKAMAPKVAGAWHLHRLTDALDFFVLFSSMASVFGSPGQGNYAAANGFLDGLAHFRRARGHGRPEHQLGTVGRRGDGDDAHRTGHPPLGRTGHRPDPGRAGSCRARAGARPIGGADRRPAGQLGEGAGAVSAGCAAVAAARSRAAKTVRRGRLSHSTGGVVVAGAGAAAPGAQPSGVRHRSRARTGHPRARTGSVVSARHARRLERARARFADGARAQEPAAAQHRPAATVDAGVRLPDGRRARRLFHREVCSER